MAAQMQCPLHQRAAIVDVEWNETEALQIEVFTCCDESRQRVCEAVAELCNSWLVSFYGTGAFRGLKPNASS
jgi:hypothetical protein